MIPPDMFRNCLEASRDGISITDATKPGNPFLYVNKAFERITGYKSDEIIGKCGRVLQREETDQPGVQRLRKSIRSGEPCVSLIRNYRKDGTLFWNELSVSPVCSDDGRILHYIGVQRDVTERVQQEAELTKYRQQLEELNQVLNEQATHDSLTGLVNRRVLMRRIAQEIRRSVRTGQSLSILMIDVDHFKSYNDTFGHQAGDEVLCKCGELMMNDARETDLAARYGGEEFMLVLPNTGQTEAEIIAERLRSTFEANEWPRRAITVSVGITTWTPVTGAEPLGMEVLIESADSGLYQAKGAGRNTCRFVKPVDYDRDAT